jgi:hypothetical protein
VDIQAISKVINKVNLNCQKIKYRKAQLYMCEEERFDHFWKVFYKDKLFDVQIGGTELNMLDCIGPDRLYCNFIFEETGCLQNIEPTSFDAIAIVGYLDTMTPDMFMLVKKARERKVPIIGFPNIVVGRYAPAWMYMCDTIYIPHTISPQSLMDDGYKGVIRTYDVAWMEVNLENITIKYKIALDVGEIYACTPEVRRVIKKLINRLNFLEREICILIPDAYHVRGFSELIVGYNFDIGITNLNSLFSACKVISMGPLFHAFRTLQYCVDKMPCIVVDFYKRYLKIDHLDFTRNDWVFPAYTEEDLVRYLEQV